MPNVRHNQLTALKVSRLRDAGTYSDGQGLYLSISASGGRSWFFRYSSAGRVREMGLGPVRDVTLAEAREAASELRRQRRTGIDPADAKQAVRGAVRKARKVAPTFESCATAYIAENRAGWKSDKHAAQWTATLATYAYPVIGHLPVATVDRSHVLAILRPIWETKAETAGRLRGRIEAVLDYAKANGDRDGDNPAVWRGGLQRILPARGRVARVQHFKAMPYRDVPAFVASLREARGVAARALEFTILTAARTGEVIGASFVEFDTEAVWTVPPKRMKAGREHRVPLTARAVAIIEEMRAADAFPYMFPGSKPRSHLSNMSMDAVLRRAGLDVTVHGFRSSFRDWAAEQTDFPREVAEACLAHTLRDKTEAAYRRTDMLEKRRDLLRLWEKHVISACV